MEQDYTYDENWGQWYSGDPSVEENWMPQGWVYSPPGEQAPPEMYNLEPDGMGGWNGYNPNEPAPIDYPDFSTPTFSGQPPTEAEQQQAVMDYISQWGLDPSLTAEAWQGEDGSRYTKDYGGNVYDESGTMLGNDMATGTEPPGAPQGPQGQQQGPQGNIPPGAQDRSGNVFVSGVGLVNPSRQIYFQGRWMTAMEAADLQHQQFLENANRQTRSADRTFAENQRQFNEREARERDAAERNADLTARGQDLSAQTSRQNAQMQAQAARESAQAQSENAMLQAQIAREKIEAEKLMQANDLAVRKEAATRAHQLALVQALLAASRGPNGPANRAMALAIMQQMGISLPEGLAGGTGTTTAVNPMGIPPAMWDQMPDSAKEELMNAWLAQGGNEADFLKFINDQRPQGRPSGASRPRFAALAGA